MSSPVETCSIEAPVREIARMMASKGIGAILACDDKRRVAGIITEQDLVTKVLAREDADCKDFTAKDVMTKNPHTMSRNNFV